MRDRLAASTLALTADPADCRGADFYIVTVPTPVDRRQPARPAAADRRDPRPSPACSTPSARADRRLREHGLSRRDRGASAGRCSRRPRASPAAATSSSAIRPSGSIPATASTRVDKHHQGRRRARRPRSSSGSPRSTARSTSGGVFRAASIKAAEAAKVIENAQRDINIAFMNEIAQIFAKLDLSVWDVLDAARHQVELPPVPARPGRRPLHRRRSLIICSHRAQQLGHRAAGDPRRARDQRRHGRLGRRALHDARGGPAGHGAGARPDLQGERARPAQQPRWSTSFARCAGSAMR